MSDIGRHQSASGPALTTATAADQPSADEYLLQAASRHSILWALTAARSESGHPEGSLKCCPMPLSGDISPGPGSLESDKSPACFVGFIYTCTNSHRN